MHRWITKKAAFLAVSASIISLAIFFNAKSAMAVMSSANYQIRWDTISNGGSDDSSSATYQLRDTLGNTSIGPSGSASYNLRSGYRQGVQDQVITFAILPQDAGVSTGADSKAGNTVTVDSTASFSVDDYVLLIQDLGESQISAFGKLVSKTATTLTVDDFADNGTAPTIDGAGDFVFLMDGTSLELEDINMDEVTTGIVGWEVTADTPNGFSVQLREDGNLVDGANDINDVADGSVTAGSEEYGAISSDSTITTSTFDTADTAITTTFQAVGTTSDVSFQTRQFLTFKASASNATADGAYSQILTFVATGNY